MKVLDPKTGTTRDLTLTFEDSTTVKRPAERANCAVTLRVHKAWWFYIAMGAGALWLLLGLRMDKERYITNLVEKGIRFVSV